MREGTRGRGTPISALLERAERLRQRDNIQGSLELVEQALAQSPDHPRALFLQCRLLFAQGHFAAALERLRRLSSVAKRGEDLRALHRGLEQLLASTEAESDPAFTTESMAQLLAQQGYLLEAMEVLRRLFLASRGEAALWEEIVRLKERVERDGSRGRSAAGLQRELAAWNRWTRKRGRAT